MRENTFDTLRRCMTDVETELTEEIQDDIERLEFLHDRMMMGTPINDYEVMFALFSTGYDPRPAKPELKSEIRKEIEELTGNGDKVSAVAKAPRVPRKVKGKRGRKPGWRKPKAVVTDGELSTDVLQPAV